MKKMINILLATVSAAAAWSCSTDKPVDESSGVLKSGIIAIIPINPVESENICIIQYVCDYEILKSISFIGNEIEITREFNSSRYLPCSMVTDTVDLGRMICGKYIVRHRLTDISERFNRGTAILDSLVCSVGK